MASDEGSKDFAMLKTLIVEDSALFREVFEEALHSRFPSMEIFEAVNSQDAIDKIEKHLPGLVFVDINLAGENGLELAKRIKTEYPHIITIILTNYDLPEYREAAYRYKANHFLPKDAFLMMIDTILPTTDPNRNGSTQCN